MVMAGVSCIIGLINIGSATAFNQVISVGVSSLYASYVLTEAMLLWHRVQGTIRHPSQMAEGTWQANELVWGPFHVPGIWGILLNTFAVGYGIIVFIFSFFPQTVNPDAAHMNFASLMTGAVMIFAVVYYYAYARKVYKGPVVEINPFQILLVRSRGLLKEEAVKMCEVCVMRSTVSNQFAVKAQAAIAVAESSLDDATDHLFLGRMDSSIERLDGPGLTHVLIRRLLSHQGWEGRKLQQLAGRKAT
ncbi:MAG: hypothetical protein Q9216_004400 [Gyalolechia sp. 2 TL-2023]